MYIERIIWWIILLLCCIHVFMCCLEEKYRQSLRWLLTPCTGVCVCVTVCEYLSVCMCVSFRRIFSQCLFVLEDDVPRHLHAPLSNLSFISIMWDKPWSPRLVSSLKQSPTHTHAHTSLKVSVLCFPQKTTTDGFLNRGVLCLGFTYWWCAAPALSVNGIEWSRLLLVPMILSPCRLPRPQEVEGVGRLRLGGMPELNSQQPT